jgi:hypothetical protein
VTLAASAGLSQVAVLRYAGERFASSRSIRHYTFLFFDRARRTWELTRKPAQLALNGLDGQKTLG